MLKLKLTGEAELDARRVRAVRPRVPMRGSASTPTRATPAIRSRSSSKCCSQPGLSCSSSRWPAAPRLTSTESPADPFAADESCLHAGRARARARRFDAVNIKLDKCGGLTEALAIARRCRELGLKVMVGNMMGSSLSMAPSLGGRPAVRHRRSRRARRSSRPIGPAPSAIPPARSARAPASGACWQHLRINFPEWIDILHSENTILIGIEMATSEYPRRGTRSSGLMEVRQ
jgi:hypothetical protein